MKMASFECAACTNYWQIKFTIGIGLLLPSQIIQVSERFIPLLLVWRTKEHENVWNDMSLLEAYDYEIVIV